MGIQINGNTDIISPDDGSLTIEGTTNFSTLQVNSQNLPSAGPLSNRNLIINGAMQMAQRGTSSTSAGYQTVDRFGTTVASLSATQTQESLSSGDPFDQGFRYFYRQENTSTSTASGTRMIIYQRMEGQNIAQSGWNYTDSSSYITLSFWVRASVAQTYYVQLSTHNVDTQYNYPSSFSVSADTWTKVTKQIPGNSNLAFTNSNAEGLRVNFNAFLGTDRTDSGVSDNTWAAYATGTQCPDMTSTWANTANATFDITGVQLEVGSVATPFEHRSYSDDLRRCQRYYYRHADGSQNSNAGLGSGMWYLTTDVYFSIHFPTTMRANPTLKYNSPSTTCFRAFRAGASSQTDDLATQEAAPNCTIVSMYNMTGGTAGQSTWCQLSDASAYVAFESEL